MIVWLVVLVLVGRATSDVRSTNLCVLNDVKNAEKMKMMNEINLLNNERFVVTSNDYTYVVTMCNSASKEAEGNANVIRTKVPEHNVTVLGRYNNTDIVGRDEWRIMTFADGDVIRESSTCNGTKWKTLVILTCDPDVSMLELIDPLNVGCVSIFLLKTSIVCHPSQSVGVIIFYLLDFIPFYQSSGFNIVLFPYRDGLQTICDGRQRS
ncbi:uncharacterized protein LOC106663192 isoform X2 [Cimex lectularius]|uniref:Salivary lipocalin n=1 Tax=Cimex lectularius TaxID=79782 RepID=A0A8I6RDM0_CIMLE|nr:uncharacterized protein LOC106663192 isoform X2 [Cimex lectularius]